jgi:hypothetical protein
LTNRKPLAIAPSASQDRDEHDDALVEAVAQPSCGDAQQRAEAEHAGGERGVAGSEVQLADQEGRVQPDIAVHRDAHDDGG